MCENKHSGIMGLLLGGAIGAGLALLFAPSSGEETRRRIREGADKVKNRTKEGYDSTIADLEGRLDDLKKAVQERKDEVKAAYEAGKDAYQKEKAKHQGA